jgi:hypothetical protein
MPDPKSPFDIPVSPTVLVGSEDTKLTREEAVALLVRGFHGTSSPSESAKNRARGGNEALESVPIIGLATDVLYGRKADLTMQRAFESMMANAIVDSLPVEALNSEVLSGLDYRPYFATVAANPEQFTAALTAYGDQLGEDLGFIETLGRTEGGAGAEMQMAAIYMADRPEEIGRFAGLSSEVLTNLAVDFARSNAESEGRQLTDAELNELQLVSATVGMSPIASQAVEMMEEARAAAGPVDIDGDGQISFEESLMGGGEEALDEPVVMDRAAIESYFRTGQMDLVTLGEDEFKRMNETGNTAPIYGFDVGQMRGGGPRRGPVKAAPMTAQQAMDYLHTLTDEDAKLMQDRLAEAGYFERIGKVPEFDDGDDDATNEAWMLALTEATQQGVSIPQLLSTQRDRLRLTKAQTMQRFKIDDVRYQANQVGQAILGRNLSMEEFETITSTLKGLQTQRRDDVLGVDDVSWYRQGMDPEVGFDSTDIEQAVDTATQGAEDLQAGWDTGKKLFKMIGMDFPTVQVRPPKEQ